MVFLLLFLQSQSYRFVTVECRSEIQQEDDKKILMLNQREMKIISAKSRSFCSVLRMLQDNINEKPSNKIHPVDKTIHHAYYLCIGVQTSDVSSFLPCFLLNRFWPARTIPA